MNSESMNSIGRFRLVAAVAGMGVLNLVGATVYVSPTGDPTAEGATPDAPTTLSHACEIVPAGTASEYSEIVLKSGTADNPVVYDLSAVKLPEFGAYATIASAYVVVRSENLNRSGCVIRGGEEQDFRLFRIKGANVRFEGFSVEKHHCTGAKTGYDEASGFGTVAWCAGDDYSDSTTVFTNCAFTANCSAGSLFTRGMFYDCVFTANTNTWSAASARRGGLFAGRVTVRNCRMVRNGATTGYGIYQSSGGRSFFYDSIFDGNGGASGLAWTSSAFPSFLMIDNCLFTNNLGSVEVAGSTISNCRFFGDKKTVVKAGTVTNSVFSGYSGSIHIATSCVLNDCKIIGNDVNEFFYHVSVLNSTISGNTIRSCLVGRGRKFQDNVISNNTFAGGVIGKGPYYAETISLGGPTFWRCAIVSNSFSAVAQSDAYFFYNCLFAKNVVTGTGVSSLLSSGEYFNCTIVDNELTSTADGTAAVSGGNYRNCIFNGNTPYDLSGTGGNFTNGLYRSCYSPDALAAHGTGLVKGKARYCPPDNAHPFGYCPRCGSTATKLGDDKAFTFKEVSYTQYAFKNDVWPDGANEKDLAKLPRFKEGGMPDLGCYECWGKPSGLRIEIL